MNTIKHVILVVTVSALMLLVGYQCVVGFIRNSNDAKEAKELKQLLWQGRALYLNYEFVSGAEFPIELVETQIAIYTQAIEEYPDNAGIGEAYWERSLAYHRLNDAAMGKLPPSKTLYDKALEDYTKAAELWGWVATETNYWAEKWQEWAENRSTSLSTITVSSAEANEYIGEVLEVCGLVASTRYAPTSKGAPTWLNFDYPYPSHTFTVIIWGNDRSAFPTNPERYYENETVCVTGFLEGYQGQPQIVAWNKYRLEIQ